MKLLEIRDGVYVSKEDIIAVMDDQFNPKNCYIVLRGANSVIPVHDKNAEAVMSVMYPNPSGSMPQIPMVIPR